MKKIFTLLTILFSLPAFAVTHVITVQNFSFSPSSLNANYGDTIKWMWVSGSHTTTSTNVPAGASTWDHPISSSSQTYVYIPAKAGTYNYVCTPHAPNMAGSFTVTCPAVSGQISAGGPTTFCDGGSVVLNSFTSATIYQWKKNGVAISGATGSTKTAKNSGSYSLTVSNSCGSSFTTNSIVVTVNTLPAATVTPSDTVYICAGDSVKLKANTATSITYQWRKNGVDITGATGQNYYAKQAAVYKVTVTKSTTGCTRLSDGTRVIKNCRDEAGTPETTESENAYPNPAAAGVNFEMNASSADQVLIFDSKGMLVEKIYTEGKPVSFGKGYKAGIYFVECTMEGAITGRQKVIKME